MPINSSKMSRVLLVKERHIACSLRYYLLKEYLSTPVVGSKIFPGRKGWALTLTTSTLQFHVAWSLALLMCFPSLLAVVVCTLPLGCICMVLSSQVLLPCDKLKVISAWTVNTNTIKSELQHLYWLHWDPTVYCYFVVTAFARDSSKCAWCSDSRNFKK